MNVNKEFLNLDKYLIRNIVIRLSQEEMPRLKEMQPVMMDDRDNSNHPSRNIRRRIRGIGIHRVRVLLQRLIHVRK